MKLHQITTADEVAVLPVGSVLLDVDDDVWQHHPDGWRCTDPTVVDDSPGERTPVHYLPATVIYHPDHLPVEPTLDCSGPGRHIGPWVEVRPWSDVSRCSACGHEISK